MAQRQSRYMRIIVIMNDQDSNITGKAIGKENDIREENDLHAVSWNVTSATTPSPKSTR